MLTTCPAQPVAIEPIDKEAIFQRALAKEELLRNQAAPVPEPVVPPTPGK
jgi:hypothetical protein